MTFGNANNKLGLIKMKISLRRQKKNLLFHILLWLRVKRGKILDKFFNVVLFGMLYF